jgi:hypothetical protein
MGLAASSIHRIPAHGFDWFIHVVGGGPAVRDLLNAQVSPLGLMLGPAALLVAGNQRYEDELIALLERHVTKDAQALTELLVATPCLVISKGHLLKTRDPVYVLPLPRPEAVDSSEFSLIRQLIEVMAQSIRQDALAELLQNLGSTRLDLEPLPGGAVVATLEKLNTYFKLEPNMAGIGINLNRLIANWVAARVRT